MICAREFFFFKILHCLFCGTDQGNLAAALSLCLQCSHQASEAKV